MARLNRHEERAPAPAAERRHATALLRIARPPRAANDNPRRGPMLDRLISVLASLAVAAAALWSWRG